MDASEFGNQNPALDTLYRNACRTQLELTSLADNKSNILISINGLVVTAITVVISLTPRPPSLLIVPLSILMVSCLFSLIFAVLSARPRVRPSAISPRDFRSDRANILYFNHFINVSPEEYVGSVNEIIQDPRRIYRHLTLHIYELGRVLAEKYRLLRFAYGIFLSGLFVSMAVFFGVLLFTGGTLAV